MKLVTALMVGVRPCTCRHWLRSACQRYVRENVRPDDPPAAGRLVAQPVHHVPGQTVWAVGSCGQQRRDQPPARIRGARRWQPRPRRRPNVRQCVLPPSPLHVPHSHAGGGVGWVHARLCRSLGGGVRPCRRFDQARDLQRQGSRCEGADGVSPLFVVPLRPAHARRQAGGQARPGHAIRLHALVRARPAGRSRSCRRCRRRCCCGRALNGGAVHVCGLRNTEHTTTSQVYQQGQFMP